MRLSLGALNPLEALRKRASEAAPVADSASSPDALTPAAIVELVDRRFKWASDAKDSMLRTWATSLAFYVGEHYRNWNRKQRRLVEPQRMPAWKVLLTDNQIPGVVEMAAAKLSRSRQIPRALSDTGDDEDELAAVGGTRVLAHWWRVDGMETKELEANVQRIIFGDAFYHQFWDPTRLAKVANSDTQTGKLTGKRAPVGDVSVEVLSVFDVFPQPVERWGDIQWCIIARRKPLEWFADTFPENGKQVKADSASSENVFSALMPNSITQTVEDGNENPDERSATLKIYYEKPSAKYPRGRHFMIAGGVMLFARDELPLPHLEIPLSKKGYRYVPKRLWCAGLVETLIGQQRELNRVQNYTLQNLRLHGNPRLLAPREAKLDPEALTTDPAEAMEYNGSTSQPPSYLNPPSMPTWIQNLPAEIRSAMQQLSGQHEVSNARVPTGVTAASAIRLLQEQDDTRLAVPALLGKEAIETTARHVLATAAEFYREPRLVQVLGRGRIEAAQALMGADIGDRDVLVEVTEGVANTDAVRTENFIGWWNTGVFQAAFAGQIPWEFVTEILSELGETWVIDAIMGGRQAQEAQGPPADPQAQALQAEMELKQMELELKRTELEAKMQLEREKLEMQIELKRAELGAKAQIQQQDLAFKQQDATIRRQQDFQVQQQRNAAQAQQAAIAARQRQMQMAQKAGAGGNR